MSPAVINPPSPGGIASLTDALAQYNANLLWEGSISKARLLLESIRWLMGNRAMVNESDSVQMEWVSLSEMEKSVASFVTTQSGSRSTFTRGRALC